MLTEEDTIIAGDRVVIEGVVDRRIDYLPTDLARLVVKLEPSGKCIIIREEDTRKVEP